MPGMDSDVRTSTGTVRGRWEDGVAVYGGIPFAAAPVGPRRFLAPEPAPPWPGRPRCEPLRTAAAAARTGRPAARTG